MADVRPCTWTEGQTQGKASFPAGDVDNFPEKGVGFQRGLQETCVPCRWESTQESTPEGLRPEVTCLGDSGGSPVGKSSKLSPCGVIFVSPSQGDWRA